MSSHLAYLAGSRICAGSGRRRVAKLSSRAGAAGQRARHRQAGHRRHRRGHRHRDLGEHQLLRAARRGVRPRRRDAEHPGRHADHRRVGQRRHADRRARRPAERDRHRASSRSCSRATSRSARAAAATGAASSSTAARRSTSAAARRAGEGDTGVYGGTDPNDNSGIAALRPRRVLRRRVQPRQRAERHRVPGRRPRHAGRPRPGAHEPRRRAGVVRRHGGRQVPGRCPTPPTTASTGRSAGPGALQFVAVHQRGDDADNGIEADNNEFNNNVLPRSNPQIYNITMCGDPDTNEGGESPRGREPPPRHGVHIRNFLITGFKTIGFQIETTNTATTGQVDNGTSQMGAGVVWNIRRTATPAPCTPA